MIIPFLRPPAVVIVYLQSPRERYWGVVRHLDGTGIVLQGMDLDSFDAWMRQMAAGEEQVQLSTLFFPLLRVEKVLVDAPAGSAPSLAGRFEACVGRSLMQVLGIEP